MGRDAGRLAGKVALITGAARGQGESEARLFAAEGARVALGDLLDDEGKAVAESLGEAALYRHLDVTQEESWAEFVAAAAERFGRIDVLVNNAGIAPVTPIRDLALDDYLRVVQVNQVGPLLGIREVVPHMERAGGGSILNVSSVAGLTGIPGMVAYVSTKWALRGMTKTAALELGSAGIRVNSIHPGGIDTPMVHAASQLLVDRDALNIYSHIPIPRIGQPEEVARLALFLASDESSYCTGSEFTVDGGHTAGLSMG